MFRSKALLSFLLTCLAVVDASPLERSTGKATLNFATRVRNVGTLNVAENDRARAQALKNAVHLDKRSGDVSITNSLIHYTTSVGIGSPATDYTLMIDTGSSNTWVGANKPYVPTSSSKDTGHTVSDNYGAASFSGEEYIDTVTLAAGLVITGQSIGIAKTSSGFGGIDGILGLGPTDLSKGTVSDTNTAVPTVTDSLLAQGTISEEVIGVFFVPASEPNSGGTITFGAAGNDGVTSPVNYVSITKTSPASEYWGIDQTISYGDATILAETAGIVDTGTTLILIATNAFQTYMQYTGGIKDDTTGLLKITQSQYAELKPLTFNIGDKSYDLSPNGQIWPRSLNSAIGGTADGIYLVVSDLGARSGSGFGFINGYTFLERYYSVYDTTNERVGFASTEYTNSNKN